MAPKVAMVAAPAQVRIVPMREVGERFLEKQGGESSVEYQTGLQQKHISIYGT